MSITCPMCGNGKLVTRTSRRQGSLILRYRQCSAECGYQDRVLVQPETIVKFLDGMLCKQQEPERSATDAL